MVDFIMKDNIASSLRVKNYQRPEVNQELKAKEKVDVLLLEQNSETVYKDKR